jgi:invasion protein IalB
MFPMFGTLLRIPTFGFAIMIAATGLSFAQAPSRAGQSQQKAPASAAPQAQAQPQPEPQPQQQQPQSPPPPQPIKTEILNFDNWSVTCREFAEGKRKRICFALLQIVQQNNNQTVFSWTIGFDDDNHQLMTLQTPTGVAIAPGVDLKLTKGNRVIPYTACDTGHCVASSPVDANLIRDLTATTDAQAVIHASDGRDVTVNIPMKGFDRAYAALPK